MSWPWSELGLTGPADLPEVRRAYAERLKTTHPEENPEGFQRLHEAYQQARRLSRNGGSSSTPQPQERQEEPDWDYGGLVKLENEDEPDLEEPDWDFEGIFSEQAAQRAENRERHAQERREAYFARHAPANAEEIERLEEQWPRLDRALATLEELHASGAPLYVWTAFLNSSAFFSVKGDEDFAAGLENFLRHTPDLDGQVKLELSKAFSLRRKDVPAMWQGLRKLLLEDVPSEAEVAEEIRQKKGRKKVWMIGAAAVAALAALGVFLGSQIEAPGQADRDRLCQYMEEDFGRAVESHWKGRDNYENLYALWDQPDLLFVAWPEGERNLAAGQLGYATNYSNVMVTQALKDLADVQGWELRLIQEGGCDGVMGAYGTSPGSYVLVLPLTGGGEGITALGQMLEELESEPWYQAFPPSFQMIFAYRDLTYYTYAAGVPFEAETVRNYYENEMGADLCEFLVEKSGLVQEDFGEGRYELEPQGPVELGGKTYFLVSGLDTASENAVRQYLFDGLQLVSLPAEEFSLDMKAYQLSGDRFASTWADMPQYIWISRK